MKNIIVLNGSPMGIIGDTIQYIRYIQQVCPDVSFNIINISQDIGKIEKNGTLLEQIKNKIKESDGVIWATPVYIYLVPSQYKRFIEMIYEKKLHNLFHNKYAAILTTSVHFYDHIARDYLHAICDDLNMKCVGSYTAEMDDLLLKKEQVRLQKFIHDFIENIDKKHDTIKRFNALKPVQFKYESKGAYLANDPGDITIRIITDNADEKNNIGQMIKTFKKQFTKDIEVINLNTVIKTPCTGCLKCGYDNTCQFQDADDFVKTFNHKVKTSDILIFAGEVKDRYFSSTWKAFFDRCFFNTHIPQLIGKQMCFLISGPFNQICWIREMFEAYCEWQGANCAGFITDESEKTEDIDTLIAAHAGRLLRYAKVTYIAPQTFLGVAAHKIFRDMTWGKLRLGVQADYRYFKKNRLFDFPQRDYDIRLMNITGMLLTKIPVVRNIFYSNIKNVLSRKHRRLLKNKNRRNDNAE